MKIISHRGNIKGPVPHLENEPTYIDAAISYGFDVEVDIRFVNGEYWLGHDSADHKVTTEWILQRKNNLWFHCKDLYSACALNGLDSSIIKFCHSSDSFVLVSNGTIWVHDLTLVLDTNCVIPLMGRQDIDNYTGGEVYGICTDYPIKMIENKPTLLWTTPSITCLGDRLLDTMILSTYAKLLGANLHFPWVDCPFTIGQENPTYAYKNGENKPWDKVRFEDYRFENYTQYFNLPKNIKINEPIKTVSPNYFFNGTLGGCVSPSLFYAQYASNICTLEEFKQAFKETMREFTPTKKLLALVKGKTKPHVSVHLRRTDKINVRGDYSTFMTYDGLDELNNKTIEAINKLYDDEKLFYFSSDDSNERDKYHTLYPKHIEHDTTCSDIEKTYIDLYTMSVSDYIILSQVHSNFSVFASYMNNSKLVYLYDKCLITDQQFNKSDNFINYKNI